MAQYNESIAYNTSLIYNHAGPVEVKGGGGGGHVHVSREFIDRLKKLKRKRDIENLKVKQKFDFSAQIEQVFKELTEGDAPPALEVVEEAKAIAKPFATSINNIEVIDFAALSDNLGAIRGLVDLFERKRIDDEEAVIILLLL